MAVDLQHTGEDTTCSLPSSDEFLPYEEEEEDDDDLLSHSQPSNSNSNSNRNDKEDDLIAELTHHMDRFLQLQDEDDDDDDHKFDLSPIGGGYHNSELSWDLIGSPQSTLLWSSPMGSNQGSSEGSSQEASPPPTPTPTPTLSTQYYPPNHHHEIIHSFNPSINIPPSDSHQSLIHQQIRAIELSRLKQEQVRLLKQKLDASNGESEETSSVGRRTGPSPPPMRAVFLGGSASRGGTGVFLPRSASALPQSTNKKQGKGCSTVLIPERVVQALQQHFDQMATASGPKAAAAFPPLHDVLVSNRDGMYSLQKRHSRKSQANQNMNTLPLPQDWTY